VTTGAFPRYDVRPSTTARRPIVGRRFFHIAVALVMLALTIAGFHPYYMRGVGEGGRIIDPSIVTLVAVHGTLATAWFVLFLMQAALIPSGYRRVHMRLGWGAAAVGLGVAVSGALLALASVRLTPPFQFFSMAYKEFLLVMFTEMAAFTALLIAGLLWRRKPERHRAMMLLASLSILAGATSRMPVFFPVYGHAVIPGLFGPIFTLGLIVVAARTWLNSRLDLWLTGGYLALVVVYVGASTLAVSEWWNGVLQSAFRL